LDLISRTTALLSEWGTSITELLSEEAGTVSQARVAI